mmetsp:Transcript_14228/g.47859  ORF Transcript_14228/g.47859 Transcript_14228/m.47859 type:complete len:198 (+) Transcript_14228:34-627(+)
MLSLALSPLSLSGLAPRSVSVSRIAAPQMVQSKSMPMMEAPEHLQGMVGNVDFDPLGLSSPNNIKWMREAELKHGRMSMLAWTGYVAVDLGLRFPGARYAELNSFNAHDVVAKKELFLLLLWVGTFETIGASQIYDMSIDASERKPGDFGFDPLRLLKSPEAPKYYEAELVHGRAAMLAFSAVVTQSALGNTAFPYF